MKTDSPQHSRFLLAIVGCIIVVPSNSATTTFTDTTFNLSDYSYVIKQSGGATIDIAQRLTAGNPDAALEVTTKAPLGGTSSFNSSVYFLNNSFTYNPATQGAIQSISYYEDVYMGYSGVLGQRGGDLLLYQDGNYYIHTDLSPSIDNNTWSSASSNNLLSTDFNLITNITDYSIDSTQHPNFATSNLQFGVLVYSLNIQAGTTMDIRVDNESIIIYSTPVPPAPPLFLSNIDHNGFASGVLGNKLYVFGGHNSQSNSLKSTEVLNLSTSLWTNLADNENNNGNGVESITGATVNGQFYVFGAVGGCNSSNEAVNFVQAYDPASDTWAARAAMPTSRYAATAVTYNDEIYVFGGAHTIRNKTTLYKVVEAFKPTANAWRKVTKMPLLRQAPALTVVGNKAYVIGGLSLTNMTSYSDVSTYNFTTKKWNTTGLTALPTPRGFSNGHSAPVLNGKIYLIGGGTLRKATKAETKATGRKFIEGASNRVEIYDPASNTWQIGPSLPLPSKDHVSVVANDIIYLLGGTATSNNVVWQIKDSWKATLGIDETCDLNADGKFTSKDSSLFAAACKNGSAYWQCDLNNDGKFNTKDTASYNRHWKSYVKSCTSV